MAASALSKRAKVGNVITFVTGNANKLKEAKQIFGSAFPFDVTNSTLDLPELQGDPDEVAREKCNLAAKAIGGPVMVEDVSLGFNAMGGLPGVYIKWFLKKLGLEGLNRMLADFDDKSATATCTYAYSSGPGRPVHIFPGVIKGSIVPPRGPTDFGWDAVFEPEGYSQTYAEMDSETKNGISHRRLALDMMRESLTARVEEIKSEMEAVAAESRGDAAHEAGGRTTGE